MNKCKKCESLTKNPKFCSRSCAAKYNNVHFPKRKTSKICSRDSCEEIVKSYRHTLCAEHWEDYVSTRGKRIRSRTLAEYRTRKSVAGKHPSWLHAHIRGLASVTFKHLKELPCENCGYTPHVELCHIIPISSFPDDALVSEVNSEKNIIQLCRNCHWELDNGLLSIDSIRINTRSQNTPAGF